jgi:vacuolar protein sorting-associated protein 54
MIQDVDVFINKLQKVDGFGDAGEYLTNIVKSKKVEADSPPAPAPATTAATTTTTTATTNGTDEAKTTDVEQEKKTSSEGASQE